MSKTLISLTLPALSLLLAQAAEAALPVPGADGNLVYPSGAYVGAAGSMSERVPEAQASAWARFRDVEGAKWHAAFDTSTGVVSQILGDKIEVPGSIADKLLAERAARRLLLDHLSLLAPGARPTDFELVSNVESRGLRVVGFAQRHDGLPVEGGQLSFRFKNDRLFAISVQAWPNLTSRAPNKVIAKSVAEDRAIAFLRSQIGQTGTTRAFRGAFILPLPASVDGTVHARDAAVVEVLLDTTGPIGRWAVYLDARTGEPIARRQTLMFGDGTILYNAPERRPGSTRLDYPAERTNLTVDGLLVTTDAAGVLTWNGQTAASVTLRAQGPHVNVINAAGTATSATVLLQPGGSYVWNASRVVEDDAQLITYVASHTVQRHARVIAPELAWIDEDQLVANVNLDDVCNAFSDGQTINFYRAGQGCENMARIPDVVYHEYGHALHFHSIISGVGRFDSAFSEGASDYLSATITGDSGMGRGIQFNNTPLRELDPVGSEARWPDDVARDPHETGLIFGGAMWDLRKALIVEMGPLAGKAYADQLFYGALQRSASIPGTWLEVLAGDDDDGDLGNGTPHVCMINEAFGRHGIVDLQLAGPGLTLPWSQGLAITIGAHRQNTCPGTDVTSVIARWKVRGQTDSGGDQTLEPITDGYRGMIPFNGVDQVVRYKVIVTVSSGESITFPNNPADPEYEIFVGDVTPLYCTDLENLPGDFGGWSHELVESTSTEAVDDWQFGTPYGAAGSGDPDGAHSGFYAFGTNLGGTDSDGRYQPDTTTRLRLPMTAVGEFTHVRLQYWRWLTVEDSMGDQARILNHGAELWVNARGTGTLNHIDKEWRFHDVDLSQTIRNGVVDVTFELDTNRRRRYGGWNVDDFCIVGVNARCGNGRVEAGEACDDGNTTDGDGCDATCAATPVLPVCGNGNLETGEACDDGNQADGDGCETNCTATVVTPAAVCGNGQVEANEACDDGALDGRACNPGCVLPVGDPGVLEPPVDDGCSCTASDSSGSAWALLGLIGLVLVRRRR